MSDVTYDIYVKVENRGLWRFPGPWSAISIEHRMNTSDLFRSRQAILPILLIVFFVSGATGLVYEVIWTRKATLIFGATLYSTSTVLAAFMGGLAFGGLLFGRLADGPKSRPLLYYALLEIGIGIYALLTPLIFRVLQSIQFSLYEVFPPGHFVLGLARFLLLVAALIPPTLMMGGTLPIIAKFVVRSRDSVGRWMGRLYFLNTAGAVVGTLLSTFLLIATLGVNPTVYLTGLLNLGIGAIVLLLQRNAPQLIAEEPSQQAATAPGPVPRSARRRARPGKAKRPTEQPQDTAATTPTMYHLLVAAVAISGLASLSLEISWFRALALVLGSSIYAFGLMLAAFLAGIALGGLLAAAFADRVRNPWPAFALLQLATSMTIIAFSSYLDRLPLLFVDLFSISNGSFWAIQSLSMLLIFLVMLIPTTLMGMAFPLAIKLWNRDLATLGRSVGYLYFANTAAALLGALITGFILIPVIGTQWSVRLSALLYLVAGASLWFSSQRGAQLSRWAVTVAASLAVVVLVFVTPRWDRGVLAGGAFLKARQVQALGGSTDLRAVLAEGEQVYYKEGLTATVVVEKTNENLTLIINGKPDASLASVDMETQILLGHLPMLLHPDPQNVLVVGLGSGITLGSVLQYPVKQVDVVEIERAVVEAASQHFTPYNHDALRDPRVRLVVDDARTFVAASSREYDIITAEPSNPWVKGMSTLFTREQFQLYREHLAEDGILVQWLHLTNMSPENVRMVAATFQSVFPHTLVWGNPGGTDIFLVGTKKRLSIDYGRMADLMSRPEVREDAARGGLDNPLAVLSLLYMNESSVQSFASGSALHTNDHPRLEYSAPRNLYSSTLADNLEILSSHEDDVTPLLTNVQRESSSEEAAIQQVADELERLRKSQRLTLQGKVATSRGDNNQAALLYQESLNINPDNLSARTYLAMAYLALGNTTLDARDAAAATDLYQKAVESDPSFTPARRALAYSYAQQGRLEEAIDQLGSLLEQHPEDATARAVRGLYLDRLGRNDEAEKELLQAIQQAPQLTDARNVLADIYLRQNRRDEASYQLAQSLRANPGQPEIRDLYQRLTAR